MFKKVLIGSMVVGSTLFANLLTSKQEIVTALHLPTQIAQTLQIKTLDNKDQFGFKEFLLTAPRLRPMIVYFDKSKNLYMLGMIIKNGENLTSKKLDSLNNQVYLNFIKEIPKTFKLTLKGMGKGKITIFTDPQCPFCKEAEKKGMLKYVIKHYKTIEIINYPLSFHRQSNERVFYLSQKITNAKTNTEKIKALKEAIKMPFAKLTKKAGDYKKCDVYIDNLKKLRELTTPQRFGTPTFIDEKGNNISKKIMMGLYSNGNK